MLENIQFTEKITSLPVINKILNFTFKYFFRFYRMLVSRKDNKGGVVIVSLHRIGDTIFTFPAVRAIQDHYKNKKITLVCYQSGSEIYSYFFKGCNTVVLKKEMFYLGERLAGLKARRIIRDLQPEIIIDLTACMKSTTLIFDSSAKEISGTNRELFRGLYRHFAPVRVEPQSIDLYLDAIKFIPNYTQYKSVLYKPVIKGNGNILIFPFAGWKAKEWGIKHFINLADELKKNNEIKLVFEPGSVSKEILTQIKKQGIEVIETSTVTEMLQLIADCSIVISNDTGCIHLAAALGRATYTIFGPTNPRWTNAGTQYHRYINKTLPCSPGTEQYCFTFAGQKGCPSFLCMTTLSEKEVFNDIKYFLKDVLNY